ncbi:Hypothetical predicted protein [Paramuricea clavata]|nr:Hypothetical predicted protein [Paramuricea clavata]
MAVGDTIGVMGLVWVEGGVVSMAVGLCGAIAWDVVGDVRVKVSLGVHGMAVGDTIGVLGWVWVGVVSMVVGLCGVLVGGLTGVVDCGRIEIGLVNMVDGEFDGVLVNRLFSKSGSDMTSKRCSVSISNPI